jgi:hypothetical protein
MRYATAHALRTALEQRLNSSSRATGISHDRLRRRVVFERVVARLQAAERGRWIVKGGMALEVRLRDKARLTRDLDVGLRDEVAGAAELRERLVEALARDPDGDRFLIAVQAVTRLMEDDTGRATWRARIAASLADRPFGTLQLDVSPRPNELDDTDEVPLPNSLEFAGIVTPNIELIDVHRHVAEKFHGMLKSTGERENTRVRDLVDLVLLSEQGLVDPTIAAGAIRRVWAERATAIPDAFPELSPRWLERYEALAGEIGLAATTFPRAVQLVARLWATMFPSDET